MTERKPSVFASEGWIAVWVALAISMAFFHGSSSPLASGPSAAGLNSDASNLTPSVEAVLPPQVRARAEETYVAPKHYLCYRTTRAIIVDGRLDEPAWQAAPWTDDFVDIEGDLKPPPRYRTRVKMLWDDECFYIAAELEEPHVWGTLTVHDSVIFQDNDFEVFIDPDGDNHNYGEFEINALNTGWDLRLTKPYKDGGRADDGWEIPGLKTAVHVNGTINDPRDTDRGWTVEIAIPWSGLAALFDPSTPVRPARREGPVFIGYEDPQPAPASSRSQAPLGNVPHGSSASSETPKRSFDGTHAEAGASARGESGIANPKSQRPRDGDQWRVNFSRVEWRHRITADGKYQKVPNLREDNWVWSPQWTINMHRPETWGYVQFSTAPAGSDAAAKVKFLPDPAGPARHLLHRVYYAQHDYRKSRGHFAENLDDLKLANLTHETIAGPMELRTDADRFEATVRVRLPDGATNRWHIREDSCVWQE